MAYGFGRPSRLVIKQNVRDVIRTFPTTYILVKRRKTDASGQGEVNESGEQEEGEANFVKVYEGEAAVRPAGGVTETYGLGTVENVQLVIVIVGDWGLRQGDIVTINDGKDYEVMFPPVWFDAVTILQLNTRSQIRQPV